MYAHPREEGQEYQEGNVFFSAPRSTQSSWRDSRNRQHPKESRILGEETVGLHLTAGMEGRGHDDSSSPPQGGVSLQEGSVEERVTPRLDQLGQSRLASGILTIPLDPEAKVLGEPPRPEVLRLRVIRGVLVSSRQGQGPPRYKQIPGHFAIADLILLRVAPPPLSVSRFYFLRLW